MLFIAIVVIILVLLVLSTIKSDRTDGSHTTRVRDIRANQEPTKKSEGKEGAPTEESLDDFPVDEDYPSVAEMAGYIGENQVSLLVWCACRTDSRHYRILNNVYLPLNNGKLTEIDVLLLHETGIYVFESKNMSGYIYGEESAFEWKRSKDGESFDYFPNPIRQNERHVEALIRFLKLDCRKAKVFNVVVFGAKAELESVPENTESKFLYQMSDLEGEIVKKMNSRSSCNSKEVIEKWFRCLNPRTQLTEEQKKAHKERVSKQSKRS